MQPKKRITRRTKTPQDIEAEGKAVLARIAHQVLDNPSSIPVDSGPHCAQAIRSEGCRRDNGRAKRDFIERYGQDTWNEYQRYKR